jgi:hypothetical protein
MSNCRHEFLYAGMRYCDGANAIPGGGARRRYYAHVFFCKNCTETKGEPLTDHPPWNTYAKILFNATPGTPDQCGIPLEDRS